MSAVSMRRVSMSTVPVNPGAATSPSLTISLSQSTTTRPSASSEKHSLFLFTNRLHSVTCIPSDTPRSPLRRANFMWLARSTICLNSCRLLCCFAVRGLRTCSSLARRHHLPRHSYPMTVPTVPR